MPSRSLTDPFPNLLAHRALAWGLERRYTTDPSENGTAGQAAAQGRPVDRIE